MRKQIKKVLHKFGFTILNIKNYNQLLQFKETNNSTPVYKNELLKNFFTLLKNQNYYPKAIYDIGANKGTWTYECLKYFPDAIYYLFEPQINLKEDITALLNNYDNVNLFSLGVGDINDNLNFTMHERDDSCSFTFTEEEAKAKGYKQIKLPIVRLDSFIKENSLKAPNILKIDAEGLDLKVLEGSIGVLENVEIIMVEVAIVHPEMENTALNVLNYLDLKGFKLFDFTDINRPFSNQVLWLSEFVFIKKGGLLDISYR